MANRAFDRSQEDFGNVLNMEHINLTVPDQQVAALFYVTGLGFTRDPYVDFGTFNMWINVGEQQFHLPKRTAQKFRCHIGVVVPDLEDLKRRLEFIDRPMQGTGFSRQGKDDHIALTCPWGNDIRAYGPAFGTGLGIPFAVVDVPTASHGSTPKCWTRPRGGRDGGLGNGLHRRLRERQHASGGVGDTAVLCDSAVYCAATKRDACVGEMWGEIPVNGPRICPQNLFIQ